MRLAEEKKIVPLLASANYGAGLSMDSINMKNFHKASIIMTFGAISGSAVLKVYSGATAAAATSAMPFDYAYAGGAIAAASGDVLAANATATAASGLTLASGSKMLVVEVDASDMDIANGEEWLTPTVSAAATSGICHAVAVLEPRYSSNRSATATA
jgi:hypothetical protein